MLRSTVPTNIYYEIKMAQDELSKNARCCKKIAKVVAVQIILHIEADFISKGCGERHYSSS
jgi:hypothetical protein